MVADLTPITDAGTQAALIGAQSLLSFWQLKAGTC